MPLARRRATEGAEPFEKPGNIYVDTKPTTTNSTRTGVNFRPVRCYPHGMQTVDEEHRVADLGAPAHSDDDARLLALVAAGERTALTALYERWWRPLFAFLLTQTPDHAVAEEILQDTMVAVWQGSGGFEGRAKASTWLFGIARRQAWNRLRGRAPHCVYDADLTGLPAADAGPEDVILARERVAQVAAAMARLSPLHREVLVLAFDGRLSYDEIADVLDAPVGTVRSRLSNARRALLALTDPAGKERL